jgi:chemotaxis protein MotB
MISGCVSTGTYKDMESTKNQEITGLQEKVNALEKQNTSLKEMETSKNQEHAGLQEKVSALEKQNATLATTSQQQQKQYDTLVQDLSKEVEKGQLQVKQYKNMMTVDLAEQLFFNSGSAELKADGKAVLKKVAAAVKDYENKMIRVVGYTDNVPVKKSGFKSNWDLSAARAVSVVRFLQESGVPPARMIAAGRGEYNPVAPNDTPKGRKMNRRIEIMLIDQSLADELARSGK